MPSKSGKMHRAMAAAAAGHSTLGIPQSVGEEFVRADKGHHFKGGGTVACDYAKGGPVLNESRSRFMKAPNVFTTDEQRQDYRKTSPAGELGIAKGETKVLAPIKPQA